MTARQRDYLIWVGLLVAILWPTMVTFPATWVAFREHGWVVACFTLWLLWRNRSIADGAPEGRAEGTWLLLLLSLAWFVGVVANLGAVHQLLATVMVFSAIAVVSPRSEWSVVSRIGATFLLAVPVWSALLPILQRLTVIVSGAIARLGGVDAEIEAFRITIESGTFLVARGCAGLNYLMGGLTLGAVFAHLYATRWQTQLKLVALVGLVSIVGNWLRVSFLIFVGAATEMQSSMLGDHLWQGWLIFMILMVPTYWVASRIVAGDRVPGVVEDDPEEDDGFDELVDGSAPFDRDITEAGSFRSRAWAPTLALAVGPLLYMMIGVIPRGTPDQESDVFGAVATLSEVDEASWTPPLSGIDERATWRADVGPVPVELTRFYFLDQVQGEELVQGANAIAPDSLLVDDRPIGPLDGRGRIVRQAVFVHEGAPRVAWYWYRVGGVATSSAPKAKLLEVLSFLRRSPASELVTASVPCDQDRCDEAVEALAEVFGVEESSPR